MWGRYLDISHPSTIAFSLAWWTSSRRIQSHMVPTKKHTGLQSRKLKRDWTMRSQNWFTKNDNCRPLFASKKHVTRRCFSDYGMLGAAQVQDECSLLLTNVCINSRENCTICLALNAKVSDGMVRELSRFATHPNFRCITDCSLLPEFQLD